VAFFTQSDGSRLYTAQTHAGDGGWLAYLLPAGTASPGPGIELSDAFSGTGSFVFATTAPAQPTGLIAALDAAVGGKGGRALLWVSAPDAAATTVLAAGLTGSPPRMGQLVVTLTTSQLTLIVSPCTLGLDSTNQALTLTGQGGAPVIAFGGGGAPPQSATQIVRYGTLPLAGPQRGCVTFDYSLQRAFLTGTWMGFQLVIPDGGGVQAARYPLASAPATTSQDLIGFAASIDPADPRGVAGSTAVRSALAFTGTNYDGTTTTLQSAFMTPAGEPVILTPVGGDPNNGMGAAWLGIVASAPLVTPAPFLLAPAGTFAMSLASAQTGAAAMLLCGLNPTEAIGFETGDRIIFTPHKGAYVPRYPLPAATATGPVVDATAALLDGAYLSSWASIAAGGQTAPTYHAQPVGATLYGRGGPLNTAHAALLDASDGGAVLPSSAVFPVLPYTLVTPGDRTATPSGEVVEDLERLVVAPTRRVAIGPPTQMVASRARSTNGPGKVTTPAGLLVSLDSGGGWSRVLLGQNDSSTGTLALALCAPTAPLQQALSSSQAFVVVTDPRDLGALAGAGDGTCAAAAQFFNQINIGGWQLAVDVGANQVGDYTNVVIVKGRHGALWDATSQKTRADSLISNPQKWTQPEDFGPDGQELTALSYWLQAYCEDARTQSDASYFEHFNAIARDPGWMGILVLRATIAAVPPDLAGITAGVRECSAFYAHHFAVEISQVANDPQAPDIDVEGPSSIFGLIHYVDPAYTEPAAGQRPAPLPGDPGVTYDFRLLVLKALFANTTVSRFESTAQLTLNQLFGSTVRSMDTGGNAANAIVLSGSYQNNGGHSVYSLTSQADNVFNLDCNVLPRVEVTGAQMSTRSAPGATDVVSWFALSGFMDFALIQADGKPFDLLAYGNASAPPLPRHGLSFANLGLQLTFPAATPTDHSFAFATSEITFDAGTSTPRPGSLLDQFALELDGLATGGAKDGPDTQGYLPVITDATLRGVAGGEWYGLRFRVNLGSPGKLAGEVGLTSSLLIAWKPDSSGSGSYDALTGLRLPGSTGGASLISLENVLKLSIGQLALTVDQGSGRFLLMLGEIALRFLGLLKLPPSGSTSFYVFGDPANGGKGSGLGWYAMYTKAQSALTEGARR